RNASASPAINPPPTRDVVLMSVGTPSARDLAGTARPAAPFHVDEKTPPRPNHSEVVQSTNPPKLDAYGLGRRTASTTKSAARAPLLFSPPAWYAALSLRSRRPHSHRT